MILISLFFSIGFHDCLFISFTETDRYLFKEIFCQITSIIFWLFWFHNIFVQSVTLRLLFYKVEFYPDIFSVKYLQWCLAFIALIEILLSSESHSNFESLRVINFLSFYFRYLSKEIIPKVLGFDFKRDFQSNFKTKLKENNLNTQWKWWTVCMPRLKRLIVPHSVKVKICTKYI